MEVSKMVVDRQKSASKVIAAAHTHKSKVGTGMTELLGRDFGVAAEQLMDASAEALKTATRAMVTADEAHIAELDDDPAHRAARDAAADQIRNVFVDFRDLTRTMFGASYVASLGYEGETPEDPVMLHRLGQRILDRIDKTDRPHPRFEGMTFDPGPWKQKISDPLAKLDTALKNTNTEVREAEQTLSAKHRAIEAYDAVFSKTAGLVSAMLCIAGEQLLADRVRPVKSKPGQITDPDAALG
ncbi:MAG: hypothetical protein QNJ97_17305 [Myxococcota bacterium]|nr:hypothetical protein [Myxococcota bacterium]